jgi:F-type H+-transporting ATPase subunit epsilon
MSMDAGYMVLEILSPEKTLFKGDVTRVFIPGAKAPFVILYNHAPIISLLGEGSIKWNDAEGEHALVVSSGFAEAANNHITVCIEKVK